MSHQQEVQNGNLNLHFLIAIEGDLLKELQFATQRANLIMFMVSTIKEWQKTDNTQYCPKYSESRQQEVQNGNFNLPFLIAIVGDLLKELQLATQSANLTMFPKGM